MRSGHDWLRFLRGGSTLACVSISLENRSVTHVMMAGMEGWVSHTGECFRHETHPDDTKDE